MNLKRKPYEMKGLHPTVDFAQIRAEIMDLLREKPMTTDEIIKALLPRYTRHATYNAIRYAKSDGHIKRDKHSTPWRVT